MKKSCYAPWAVLLLTGLIGLSCSRLDEIPQNEAPETPEKTFYTLIIKAEKEAPTKALEDMGTTLKSTWTAGDKVTVYGPGNQILGTLTASTGGSSSTTLQGDLTEAPTVGDVLTLKLRSDSYLTQKGTLDYIAANCDYALATATVETVSEMQITTTPALFVSQQAIVKLTIQDAGGNALAVSQLLLTAEQRRQHFYRHAGFGHQHRVCGSSGLLQPDRYPFRHVGNSLLRPFQGECHF